MSFFCGASATALAALLNLSTYSLNRFSSPQNCHRVPSSCVRQAGGG